jgi:hypothetical protein
VAHRRAAGGRRGRTPGLLRRRRRPSPLRGLRKRDAHAKRHGSTDGERYACAHGDHAGPNQDADGNSASPHRDATANGDTHPARHADGDQRAADRDGDARPDRHADRGPV